MTTTVHPLPHPDPGEISPPANSLRRPRGPATAVAKASSRQNALQHGLRATVLIGDVFGNENLARLRELGIEWQPQTPINDLLLDELARHAAALQLAERAEAGVLRSGCAGPPRSWAAVCRATSSWMGS